MVFHWTSPTTLFNQHDLIKLRKKHEIDKFKPGITGWAQINGRDSITIEKKCCLRKNIVVKNPYFSTLK